MKDKPLNFFRIIILLNNYLIFKPFYWGLFNHLGSNDLLHCIELAVLAIIEFLFAGTDLELGSGEDGRNSFLLFADCFFHFWFVIFLVIFFLVGFLLLVK